jgi:hypothetical protein
MHTIYNGPSFTVDYDASDLKEAFAFLGRCQEVFGAAEVCENCKGTDIRPRYAKTQGGYEYYSLLCRQCKWEFKFGQRKNDGGLYPKGWEQPYQSGDESSQEAPSNTKQELDRQSPF